MGEPITVGIGQMINPSTFWVSPLPSSLNLEAPGDQCISKVLQLESVGPKTENPFSASSSFFFRN